MGNGYMKENYNVYFRARKETAKYDEKLSSRDSTAELLGISTSTLADYELGKTKFVPVDKVVLMAELYNHPELRNEYCKQECPIGKYLPLATKISGIEGIALRLIQEFDLSKIKNLEKNLVDIAADGIISDDEKPVLIEIIERLDEMSIAISELKLAGEKILKGKVV